MLLYAVEVLPLTKSDIAVLNHAIDRGVYRIFGCSTAEDTNYIRVAVDLPGVEVYTDCRRSKFLRMYSVNYTWSNTLVSIIK